MCVGTVHKCRHYTRCIGTTQCVSVLYISVGTTQDVSVLHNVCRYCTTPCDSVLFVSIAHVQLLLLCSRSIGLLYIVAFLRAGPIELL